LTASGWWNKDNGYHNDVKTGLEIGYDKIQEARAIEREEYIGAWEPGFAAKLERLRAVHPKLVVQREDGTERMNTGVLWYMDVLPVVKKMRFTRWGNDEILKSLAERIAKAKVGERVTEHGRTSYDVSFEYKETEEGYKLGWYSEEYRNCGNGHYYLALDATHAVYYEKD
jgi:hypothetical protein